MPEPEYVLSPTEFDVLWEHLGLGPTPAVLQLLSPGRTVGERAAVTAEALASCAADPAASEISGLMRGLGRGGARLELRASGAGGRTCRVLVAGGIRAVGTAGSVRLSAVVSQPSALLAALPTVPAGPGRAAVLPGPAFAAALTEPEHRWRASLVARGVPGPDAGLVRRMLAGATATAQICAVGAHGGQEEGPLGLLDTPRGRYTITSDDRWTTIAPADPRTVRARVAALLDGAR